MIRRSSWLVLSLLSLSACQNKEEPAAKAASPAAAPSAAPQPATVVAAATDLPTSVDFEQQALDEINPENAEQELDKLEKDIGE